MRAHRGLAIPLLFLLTLVSSSDAASPESTPEARLEAQIFEPGIISLPDRHEFGSVLSRDGQVVYFGVDTGGRSEIWRAVRGEEGDWLTPRVFLSDPIFSFNDPFLDASEQRLYFISNRPIPPKNDAADFDLFFISRAGKKWSDPVPLSQTINTPSKEYFVSLTDAGTLYFSSNVAGGMGSTNFDIYSAEPDGDDFRPARRLGTAINTRAYEADVFVAPDESYLIFAATRRAGLGRGDLYISFKDDAGKWQRAVNMGERINTSGHELCPFVSRDGRFLFTSRQDIYEIDASILESFRP